MSALVIKEWKADQKPVDSANNYVSITGRKGGLVAWLLSLVKIDPTTTIRVSPERLEFASGSIEGNEARIIPLQNICSSYYGYHKPWKSAAGIFGFFLFFAFSVLNSHTREGSSGASDFFLVAGIGFIIAAIYYFLNRQLTLGFVETSGLVNGIRFKRSVIENIDLTPEQAHAVCVIVQNLIEEKEKRMYGR